MTLLLNNYFDALEQFDVTLLVLLGNGYLQLTTPFFFLLYFFIVYNVIFTDTVYSSIKRQMTFMQSMFDMLVNFYFSLYRQQISFSERGHSIFLYNLFTFIFFFNLMGLLLYGFTITSHISLTFNLGCTVFFGSMFVGFQWHGINFLKILKPHGAPKPMVPLLLVIEVISYFSRALSLSIRLFANMMAGHALLHIMLSFLLFLLKSGNFALMFLVAPVILFFIALIFCLEVFISALQAYVFTVLAMIYLNDALIGPIEDDHH